MYCGPDWSLSDPSQFPYPGGQGQGSVNLRRRCVHGQRRQQHWPLVPAHCNVEIFFFFQLKMRTVNFILIKNLCTVDLIGALVILPVPLVATARGRFDFGDTVCTANAVINVAIWFQHIVMFAMLKVNFSSGQRNQINFFHNKANTPLIKKITFKFFLDILIVVDRLFVVIQK